MEIKLKRRNVINWLIMAMFQPKELPKSLCSYFWMMILAIGFSTIFFPLMILQRVFFAESVNLRGSYGDAPSGVLIYAFLYFIGGALTVLGHSIIETELGFNLVFGNILHGLYALGTGVLSVALVGGIIIGVAYLVVITFAGANSVANKTIVGNYIQAKKKKICPPITYED